MLVVRGTKKFLERVGPATPAEERPAGILGDWYANALFWRPQVALFVNERTLLPVFVPLAPARTVIERFPAEFSKVAHRLGVDGAALDAKLQLMSNWALARTASRSTVGTMNEFAHMAERYRWMHDEVDLVELATTLAHTPCRVSSPGEALWSDESLRSLLR